MTINGEEDVSWVAGSMVPKHGNKLLKRTETMSTTPSAPLPSPRTKKRSAATTPAAYKEKYSRQY